MIPLDIVKKMKAGERPQVQKIDKSECAASPGMLKVVVIKGNDYFFIGEEVDDFDLAISVGMWYTEDKKKDDEEIIIFNEYGKEFHTL